MEKILSIIIPTYNMENFLIKCLDSLIIKDNFEKIEVWIVNDGSKDKSSYIAHSYENLYPNVFKVIDKVNGNYGSCINEALPKCTGKYVKVLDADDWFDKENLNRFVSDLLVYDVDLIITSIVIENEKTKKGKERMIKVPNYFTVFSFKKMINSPNFFNIQMHYIAYRTEIFHKISYFQTEGISYTDQEWIFSPMSLVKTFIVFPYAVYHYLLGREGQTLDPKVFSKRLSHQILSQEARFKFYLAMADISKEHDMYLNYKLRESISLIYLTYINNIKTMDLSELERYDSMLQNEYPYMYKLSDNYTLSPLINYRFIRYWRDNHYYSIPTYVLFIAKVLNKIDRFIKEMKANLYMCK